jgi:Arc/MetJ-type ribon-helix-helix transcriptional regulator
MSTYGIKNATASIHLRLPKSMLAEMKLLCAKQDCGGMSAFVRRAVRAYLISQGSSSPQQQIKSKGQTVTEYGAASTTPNNTDEPYIPDFIKNAPGFDRETYLKFRG